MSFSSLLLKFSRILSESTSSLLALRVELDRDHPQLAPPTTVFHHLSSRANETKLKVDALVDSFAAGKSPQLGDKVRGIFLEKSSAEVRRFVLSTSPGFERPADTFHRLDVAVSLQLAGVLDPALPLSIIEELLEASTIGQCSEVFDYVESRVWQMTINMSPVKGKGLVLLRLCNELLKRLSKPSKPHTIFAGRILSLLAAVFPLGERSGVNLKGDFNVENRTVLESGPESEDGKKSGEDGEKIVQGEEGVSPKPNGEEDASTGKRSDFYYTFWRMQRYFSNPPILMGLPDPLNETLPLVGSKDPPPGTFIPKGEDPAPDGMPGPMAELRIGTSQILKLFSSVAKREKELAGSTTAECAKSIKAQPKSEGEKLKEVEIQQENPRGKRRKLVIENGVQAKETEADVENMDVDEEETSKLRDDFFPKFLTGRKLLDYELHDPSFRRHILVQYLILFQYLLSFTPASREKWKDWKNKSLQAVFVLSDVDESWIRTTWREIQALMREIPPDGKLFLDTVLETLARERSWVRWKTDMCPPIDKPSMNVGQLDSFAEARRKFGKRAVPYLHPLGTHALSELWENGFPPPIVGKRRMEDETGVEVEITTDGLEDLEFPPHIPDLGSYHRLIKREEAKIGLRKSKIGADGGDAGGKEDVDHTVEDDELQGMKEAVQSLAWRALRVANHEHLHLFPSMKGADNVALLMDAIRVEGEQRMGKGLMKSSQFDSSEAGGAASPDTPASTSSVPVAVPSVPSSPMRPQENGGKEDGGDHEKQTHFSEPDPSSKSQDGGR
ncbi:hypothetical protein IE53DRAFT_316971 [Violaceomyces palustris]|uniref:Uncharacterized protein n=1 Tax=Violaceomyces palustris TaxID=1673888 RepID=A0ACD0NVN8_9BASI|nr:hypothetical protein IE53DRAFT_316971 [Violaceomyces palustris]